MTWKLFLDDYRIPSDVPILFKNHSGMSLTIIRNAEDAIKEIEVRGCPEFISFDHDLADDQYYAPTDERYRKPSERMTGYDFAKWLVDKDLNMRGKFIPDNFEFHVHSMNPVGAENIRKLLESYLAYRGEDTTHL
jgi:hypothetical protein